MDGIRDVLRFWFGEHARSHWFEPSLAFDQAIRKRFADLYVRAATGGLESWRTTAEGCLALCILLDQMPRNMFRGLARAFATDNQALAVAEHALAQGFDRQLPPDQRQFFYLPFMHSEEVGNQLRCLALYETEGLRDWRQYAAEHLDIIRRFGRFPYRNAALGRVSTEAELQFLAEHGNRFNQKPLALPSGAAPRPRSERATRDPKLSAAPRDRAPPSSRP